MHIAKVQNEYDQDDNSTGGSGGCGWLVVIVVVLTVFIVVVVYMDGVEMIKIKMDASHDKFDDEETCAFILLPMQDWS